MKFRDATASDAPAIAALLNHYIRETTVSFTSREKTDLDIVQDIAARQDAGLPWIVAQGRDGLVGYATATPFRRGDGYAQTLEHSVFVAPEAHGLGLGRTLLERLEARGARSLVAGISAENRAALDFHHAMGFADVGRIAQAGVKFDRWIDLVLLQKHLSTPSDSG